MKVLIVNSGKSKFVIGENNVEQENLSRDDLLMILNNIYESEENVVIPSIEELDEIRNPIEKEIVQQIIQKISDFSNNVENIRQEVQAQFPVIED